jgi:hypothetical protein
MILCVVLSVWVWNLVTDIEGATYTEGVFVLQKDEVVGSWRKLHNEEL